MSAASLNNSPPNDRELFHRLKRAAQAQHFPKLSIRPKDSSCLMKTINWLFNIFSPQSKADSFLKNFWTTIGFTIFWPIIYAAQNLRYWWTLCHELGHCFQKQKWKILFDVLYLWPISQGILLLLFCWLPVFWASGWWLVLWIVGWVVVAGVHFIPQWPDPWRAHWEYQCYCISMYCYNLRHSGIPDSYITRLVGVFANMSYWKMEPRTNKMRKKLEVARICIIQGQVPPKTAWVYTPMIKLLHDVWCD